MTYRELLDLAAKAAGFTLPHDVRESYGLREWNPLTDDGDALRLAVKLGIIVCVDHDIGICGIHLPRCRGKYDLAEELGSDPYAATRRAIVRAAAEIGKA